MTCAAGQDYDAGLCYPPCPSGYDGVGPVCWQQCTEPTEVPCGAGCAPDEPTCAQAITDQVLSPLELLAGVIQRNPIDAILAAIDTFNAYNLDVCTP